MTTLITSFGISLAARSVECLCLDIRKSDNQYDEREQGKGDIPEHQPRGLMLSILAALKTSLIQPKDKSRSR